MGNFWTWLGHSADILTYITAAITFITLSLVYLERKRLQRFAAEFHLSENFAETIKDNEGVKSEKPIALAISLVASTESIKNNVATFLRTQNLTMEIVEINRNGVNGAVEIASLRDELVDKKRLITNKGCTEVHLFIQAPMFAAVLVGSVFRNWLPVKIYHKPQIPPPQIYEYQTPLT